MKVESSLATQLYSATQRLAEPPNSMEPATTPSFADAVEKVLNDVRTTIDEGERAAVNAMSGTGDLQSMVEALTATEMALETSVAVRDKVVEAYQEILRMPV